MCQWQPVDGPPGGIVNSLTTLGNNIFAASWSGGIFISSNNGQNWNMTPLNGGLYYSLASNNTTVYAGVYDSGVYKSTNNGFSWEKANLSLTVFSLAVNGSNIFAGTPTGIYRSTNDCQTWSLVLNESNLTHNSIVTKGVIIFAGSTNGLYRSTDNGQTWNIIHNQGEVYSVILNGNNILAAVSYSRIFSSTDNGQNWTQLPGPLIGVSGIISLAANGSTILAGTAWSGNGNGVYRTTNNGINWTRTLSSLIFNGDINSLLTNGTNVFAGGNGIYNSTNFGQNWTQTHFNGHSIISILASGTNIYTGISEEGGAYHSTDNGQSWMRTDIPYDEAGQVEVRSFVQSGTNIIAGASTSSSGIPWGIFVSTNNGFNWSNVYNNLYVSSLTANGANVFAATTGVNVYRSTDYGMTWSPTPLNHSVNSLTSSGSDIFAANNNNPAEISHSTNNGQNWIQTSSPGLSYIQALSVSGINLLAGSIFGLCLSTDKGNSWSSPASLTAHITSFAVSGNYVFAATSDSGIYLSSDNGQNWRQKNEGMEIFNTKDIESIAAGTDYLYAGTTENSVWKRSISEIIGIQNISTEIPNKFKLEQNFPNPFNPSTNIRYDLPKNGFVKLIVFDVLGREVQTLVNEKQSEGTYEVTFNASQYPSGVYFYRLITDEFSETKKMILMK
jgi:photosystem II stability/assembly factor-like uncharacterized protein